MAKPGRKPLAMPRTKCTVYIRTDLLAELELLLLDPMREKVRYGTRNEFIEQAIEAKLRTLLLEKKDEQHLKEYLADGPQDPQELYKENDE